MKYIKKINEGWFTKKTNIEKVQDEKLDIKNIDKIKNSLITNMDNFDKYRDAYFHYRKINAKLNNKYFQLTIKYLSNTPVQLYKLIKLSKIYPNEINIDELKSYENNIFKLFDGIIINDYDYPNETKKLIESIYYLNRINYLMNNDKKRFKIEKNPLNPNLHNNCYNYKIIDNFILKMNNYNI